MKFILNILYCNCCFQQVLLSYLEYWGIRPGASSKNSGHLRMQKEKKEKNKSKQKKRTQNLGVLLIHKLKKIEIVNNNLNLELE